MGDFVPYKSEAQRKKFEVLRAQGKISQKTLDEFNEASKGMKLPERVGEKTPTKRESKWPRKK